MKVDLAEIAAPQHTAIVTQEWQGAVVGPNAGLAVLAEEARRAAVPNIERLLPAARDSGVKVVHCLVQRRPDGLGANHNAKIFAIGSDVDIIPGSPGASLLPELGPAGCRRRHPQRLRNVDHRQHAVAAGDDHDHR